MGNFTVGDTMYEQNEIEFLPTNIQDSADQLVIAKCEQVEPMQVDTLSETERGAGGFGHTGKR